MEYFSGQQNFGNLSFLSNPLSSLAQRFPKVDLSKTIDVSKFMKEQQTSQTYSTEVPRQRYDNFSLDLRLARLVEKREREPVYSFAEKPAISYDDKNRIKMPSYKGNSANYSLSA